MTVQESPAFQGLPVPAIATWSAEQNVSPRVIQRGFGIGYLDPIDDSLARDHRHVLWTRWSLGRGKGQPQFNSVHPARQRRAMVDLLCQVCFKPAGDEDEGTLFITGANGRSGSQGPIEDGEITANPPVHLDCALEAAQHCPHLLNGHVAARVMYPTSWGVFGTRYDLGGLFPIARPEPTQVSYDSDDRRFVLAHHVLMELDGCQPVDLTKEARRARL